MALFHLQDSDRPMYVIAPSYQEALAKWQAKIREENPGDPDNEAATPQGVAHICDDDELLA